MSHHQCFKAKNPPLHLSLLHDPCLHSGTKLKRQGFAQSSACYPSFVSHPVKPLANLEPPAVPQAMCPRQATASVPWILLRKNKNTRPQTGHVARPHAGRAVFRLPVSGICCPAGLFSHPRTLKICTRAACVSRPQREVGSRASHRPSLPMEQRHHQARGSQLWVGAAWTTGTGSCRTLRGEHFWASSRPLPSSIRLAF